MAGGTAVTLAENMSKSLHFLAELAREPSMQTTLVGAILLAEHSATAWDNWNERGGDDGPT